MEPIIRNVRDIAADDRLALERIVGQPLRDNQRLTIQITDVDVVTKTPGTDIRPQQTLDDWTKVYEGLNDDEIEEVEALILDRSQWRRNSL